MYVLLNLKYALTIQRSSNQFQFWRVCTMGSNKTERRKRHRRRYIAKQVAKIQALQEQHDHNSTASIVASQDIRVHTVRSSMDGVHPDSVLPCAVKHDPVSGFQSFAAEHYSRSPVELLKEGPSVKKNWFWRTNQVHLYWCMVVHTWSLRCQKWHQCMVISMNCSGMNTLSCS